MGSGEEVVTIGADDLVSEALSTMADYQVRRLPVIGGHDLVGIISIADLAKNVDDDDLGKVIETISAGV